MLKNVLFFSLSWWTSIPKPKFATISQQAWARQMNLQQNNARSKLQIPLAQTGKLKKVSCWEFSGTAYDQGDEAASWFTKYLKSPHRLVRYAGNRCTLFAKRICRRSGLPVAAGSINH